MEMSTIYVGSLGFKVRYQAAVMLKYDYDPVKLGREIYRRANGDRWHAGQSLVRRNDETCQKWGYIVTFAYLEALDDIHAILREIESDMDAAQEQRRLLGLLEED